MPNFNIVCSSPCNAKGQGGAAIIVDKRWPTSDHVIGLDGTVLATTIGEGPGSMRIIGAHAPHSGIPASTREQWWSELKEFWLENRMAGTPTVLMGDFNATLPGSTKTLTQKKNSNATELSDFMDELGLIAANAYFTKPIHRLVTFQGTKGRTAQLDSILIPRQWKSSIKDANSLPQPTPSDHKPLEVKLRVKLKAKKEDIAKPTAPCKPDWSALTSTSDDPPDPGNVFDSRVLTQGTENYSSFARAVVEAAQKLPPAPKHKRFKWEDDHREALRAIAGAGMHKDLKED